MKAVDQKKERSTVSDSNLSTSSKAKVGWRGILLLTGMVGVALAIAYMIAIYREAPLREAEKYLNDRDPNAALTVLEPYLEENPKSTHGMSLKARALALDKKYAEANQIYQQIGIESDEDLRTSANCFWEQKLWPAALPLMIRYLDKYPDDGMMLLNLTRTQSLLEMQEDAKATALRLLEKPEFARVAHVMLADIEQKLRNYDQAIQHFHAALSDRPDDSVLKLPAFEIYNAYGDLLLQTGDPAEAIEQFKLANDFAIKIGLSKGSVGSLVGIGKSILQLPTSSDEEHEKNIAEAESYLQKALDPEIQPRDEAKQRDAAETLAQIANDRQDPTTALNYLLPTFRLKSPTSTGAFQAQRAWQAMAEIQKAAAETAREGAEKAKQEGNEKLAAELSERANKLLGEVAECETHVRQMTQIADKCRKEESILSTIEEMMSKNPVGAWPEVFRAYKFAMNENWEPAKMILDRIPAEEDPTGFVHKLKKAVNNRSQIPGVLEIPMDRFN